MKPTPFSGKARILNGLGTARSEWAPTGLPFPQGALEPSGSVLVSGVNHAFKTLERYADGSVRRALIDLPAIIGPYEERVYEFEASTLQPTGGFLPALPGSLRVEVVVNGQMIAFTSWETTHVNATRWEGVSSAEIGNAVSGLRVYVYSTAWTAQRFGRVTVILANDWKVRMSASPFQVFDARVRILGALGAPLFGWPHGLQTTEQFHEWRLPVSGGVIGDGARWGTTFTWADEQGPLPAAYGASIYPLFGYPEPETEKAAGAYGLYGSLKSDALGTTGDPYFTRQHWESHRNFWLSNCPNSPWTGHGYWTQQEGSTGGHPDWNPAPFLPDDLSMTPRGIHRMLQLSLSRLRTPDHFSIERWDEFPNAGAFLGWVSAPYRESSDYSEHLSGSNGWSGSDDAHREENARHRCYELTGEEWLYRELQATAQMACLRAKPGGGYGEGRDMARTLQRKTIAWLIARDDDRANLLANLIPWAAHLDATFPHMNAPQEPLYALSILAPGMSKYGTHGFDPGGQKYLFFPFSEAFVSGTLAACSRLLPIQALASAASKAGQTLARMCRKDGTIWDSLLEDGTGRNPRSGNLWPYPGLSAFASLDPKIERCKGMIEQQYANSHNYDEIGWLQP